MVAGGILRFGGFLRLGAGLRGRGLFLGLEFFWGMIK
jgi:hypothetical protein